MKLLIVDFDSTIFKSPLPNPSIWTKQFVGTLISSGWFQDLDSLSHPSVPVDPDESWFNLPLLKYIQMQVGVLTVLLTGRSQLFQNRIEHILKPYPYFHQFHYKKNTELSTCSHKMQVISQLLLSGQFTLVEIYEDRSPHLDIFREFLISQKDAGKIQSFECNLVSIPKCEELYLPRLDEIQLGNKLISVLNSLAAASTSGTNRPKIIKIAEQVSYTGVFLNSKSVALLKAEFRCPPQWRWIGDHLTMCLGELSSLNFQLESNVVLEVYQFGAGEGVHAIRCRCLKVEDISIESPCENLLPEDDIIISENPVPHVTLCVRDDHSPKDANSIQIWTPIHPFIISGNIREAKRFGGFVQKAGPQKRKAIPIGSLVLECMPDLKGKQIGEMVNTICDWMASKDLINCQENRDCVKEYISSLKSS